MSNRFKFTKTSIAAVPIPRHRARTTCYDSEVPKLAVRITPTGTRTFYIVKRAGMEMVWLKLGVFPDMTPEHLDNCGGHFVGGKYPTPWLNPTAPEGAATTNVRATQLRHAPRPRRWARAPHKSRR